MYDRPKGNFSFLIALAKQLHDAVSSHRDDDVGNYCESLASSMAVLLAHFGEGTGGYDESDDDIDSSIDGPELGGRVQRRDLDDDPAAVDLTSLGARRAVGAALAKRGFNVGTGSDLTRAPILTRPKVKRSKRRGKK